jgi:thiamine biosynthesis lipoprotein
VSLPLTDPQFWLVTTAVAVVAVYAARRIRRALRAESESACASCPKVAAAAPAETERPRLRVLPALLAALAAGAAHAASVERTVAAMGTTLSVDVEIATDRAAALAAAEEMIRAVEATEARLSTWRDDSELAAFNRAPVGSWSSWPSPALARDLRGAWVCSEETFGAFDLTVGPLVEAWGLRRVGRVPAERELAEAAARVGWRAIAWRERPPGFLKRTDLVVEEGGFGKGAALDAALAVAESAHARGSVGEVRLDLGGQLAWANAARPFTVELADPRDRTRGVLALDVRSARGSLSTSSNSERRGAPVGHLLDPRSGRPAADFGSATSLETRSLDADCLSTALFVLGPAEGRRLLAPHGKHEGVLLVVAGERLRALVSRGLAARVHALAGDVDVENSKSFP